MKEDMVKKAIMMMAAGLLFSAASQAQSVVIKPVLADSAKTRTVVRQHTDATAQQRTDATVQHSVIETPSVQTTSSEETIVPRSEGPRGLYEEPLTHTVKKTSTKRTVLKAPEVKPGERVGEHAKALPAYLDTVKLSSSPVLHIASRVQMAPPARTSGKVMTTRSVRTIGPKPAATERKVVQEVEE